MNVSTVGHEETWQGCPRGQIALPADLVPFGHSHQAGSAPRSFARGCVGTAGAVCPALAAVFVPTKAPPAVCAPQPPPAPRAPLLWSLDQTQETFLLFLSTLNKKPTSYSPAEPAKPATLLGGGAQGACLTGNVYCEDTQRVHW